MLRSSWPTQNTFCVVLVRFGLIWPILSLGVVRFDFRDFLREAELEIGCVETQRESRRSCREQEKI